MIVEKLDYYGRGIVHINNKICFINGALKDENVDIKIINDKKKYSEAVIEKINKVSEDRIIPKCIFYKNCGGCQLLHLKEIKTVKFKQDKIIELFKQNKINCNISDIVYDKFYHYRNKVLLHVKNNKLGFYRNKTNELIEIDNCLLLDEKINKLISILKEYIKEEKNIKSFTIKIGNNTNQCMLIIDGKVNNYDSLLKYVDVLYINDKKVTPDKELTSYIGNKIFVLRKNSFFQVNQLITKKMYDEILNIVKEYKSENVLDLYCGTGSIGIYISDNVKKVLGIEVVKDAIESANINKELNNCNNISFVTGKVEENLDKIRNCYDTVIVDPPRAGVNKNVIDSIKKIKSKIIIYVSCNPITLVRDLKLLTDSYEIKYVKPFDMFPNTYHCESVTILERR